jgi:hypothetical protein
LVFTTKAHAAPVDRPGPLEGQALTKIFKGPDPKPVKKPKKKK